MAQDTGKDTPPHFKSQNKFQLQNRVRFVNGNGGGMLKRYVLYHPHSHEINLFTNELSFPMQNENN